MKVDVSAWSPAALAEAARFVRELAAIRAEPDLFNPWGESDLAWDRSRLAPCVRRLHFTYYLARRLGRVRWVWVGEALGYRGARFSGVPFTSERILLGFHPEIPAEVAFGRRGVRTSRLDHPILPGRTSETTRRYGFAEVSATLVWRAVRAAGLAPEDVIFFSVVPFHPLDPKRGPMSNRPPRRREVREGLTVLSEFLTLLGRWGRGGEGGFPRVVAVGNVAHEGLEALGISHLKVVHPAQGHGPRFLAEIRRAVLTEGR
ncbi:MAG: uracil-DNA glycosylase [Brockia lithotrophica]|nr:uracil-DNA glycosylase [Brockia lithotrophica]